MRKQWMSSFSATANNFDARYPGLDWGSLLAVCGSNGFYAQDMSQFQARIVPGLEKQTQLRVRDVAWT